MNMFSLLLYEIRYTQDSNSDILKTFVAFAMDGIKPLRHVSSIGSWNPDILISNFIWQDSSSYIIYHIILLPYWIKHFVL